MAQRRPNPRLAKIHRSYTVEEVASLYSIHRNTVRQWIKQGLPLCDERRPGLILGRDLGDFLAQKRTRRKRPCKPGEIFCVRCRLARRPALDMADYQPLTDGSGNLIGLCPECGGLMYRRVNLAKLATVGGGLAIQFLETGRSVADGGLASLTTTASLKHPKRPAARERPRGLTESPTPSVNSDFDPGG